MPDPFSLRDALAVIEDDVAELYASPHTKERHAKVSEQALVVIRAAVEYVEAVRIVRGQPGKIAQGPLLDHAISTWSALLAAEAGEGNG